MHRSVGLGVAVAVLVAASLAPPVASADVDLDGAAGSGGAVTVPATCVPDLDTIEESASSLVSGPMRTAVESLSPDGMALDLPITVTVPATVAPGESVHTTIASTLPLGALAGVIEDDIIAPQLPGGVSLVGFALLLGDRDPRATLRQSAPAGTSIDVGSFALTSTQPTGEPPLTASVSEDEISIFIGDHNATPYTFSHPTPPRTGYILDRTEPPWTATVDADLLTSPLAAPGSTIDLLPGDVVFNLGLWLRVEVASTRLSGRVHADWVCTPNAPETPVAQVTYTSPPVGLQVVKEASAPSVLAGEDAGWTITILNTGTTPLTGVTLSDPLEPDCDRAIGSLAALTSTVVTCSTATSASDVGDLTNSAIVGSDQTGPAAGEDDATVEVTGGCLPPGPFVDVPDVHPFCAHIAWLVDSAIALGYPDGTFRPVAPITRQAMSAFLYRMAGSPDGDDPSCSAPPFADVPTDHSFCGEIEWMEATEIAGGYADGRFHPTDAVSRQAMAAFVRRLVGAVAPLCVAAPFNDVPTSNPFCGDIAWMVGTGIADGYADGGYHPTASVSRQAMAAFLARTAPLLP